MDGPGSLELLADKDGAKAWFEKKGIKPSEIRGMLHFQIGPEQFEHPLDHLARLITRW